MSQHLKHAFPGMDFGYIQMEKYAIKSQGKFINTREVDSFGQKKQNRQNDSHQ